MPARFQLIAAMNPCPCGHRGSRTARCTCTPGEVRSYLGRLSGPLLDRIDLHVGLLALGFDEASAPPGEGTAAVRLRVAIARERQARRSGRQDPQAWNASLSPAALRRVVRPGPDGVHLLRHAVDRLGLSARGLDRVLRVARTIADLVDSDDVTIHHLSEALGYRCCVGDTDSGAVFQEVGERP